MIVLKGKNWRGWKAVIFPYMGEGKDRTDNKNVKLNFTFKLIILNNLLILYFQNLSSIYRTLVYPINPEDLCNWRWICRKIKFHIMSWGQHVYSWSFALFHTQQDIVQKWTKMRKEVSSKFPICLQVSSYVFDSSVQLKSKWFEKIILRSVQSSNQSPIKLLFLELSISNNLCFYKKKESLVIED